MNQDNINLNEQDHIDDNNPKSKNEKKLSIITIIIIIIAIIGYGLSIFHILAAFIVDGWDGLGYFVGGIRIFIGTSIIMAFLLIFYLIIDFYNSLNNKQKRIFKLTVIVALLSAISVYTLTKYYNYTNKNLAEVLNDIPNSEYYDTSSYYFIYNDKIYYYVWEGLNDKLFAMNLDGTGNKKIAETDELRYANFYFVYNNEAYYYTTFYKENKKINLATGQITSLGNNDFYISKTLKNGEVNTLINYNDCSILKKVDLTNNKTLSEIKTFHGIAGKEYYLDYDGGNIYYLEDFDTNISTIYKNADIVYQFDNEKNKDIDFIAVNEDYLYYEFENHIYKLNTNSKEIENKVECNLGDIHRIGSGNNTDNYFYINGKIYELDLNNDKFNLILNDIKNKPDYVYNINNKLIFTENTDNKYNNNLGLVVIYDISSKSIEKFDSIRKVCFDENYMYLLINNYVVQKYQLNS